MTLASAFFGILLAAAAVSTPLRPVPGDPPRPSLSERMKAATEQVQPLGGGLYLIRSDVGSNVTVFAGDDGILVVDTQFAGMEDKLLAAVRSISDKPIRLVVNTHGHPDHVGANPAFVRAGAVVIGQDLVLANMARDQPDSVNGGDTPAFPAQGRPTIAFDRRLALSLNGEQVELTHVTPLAHTQGDTILRFPKANVLVAGDLFSNHFYPGFDVDRGGSIDGVIEAQAKLLKMVDDQTRIVPGHGPLAGKADLAASHAMLLQIRERVARLVAAGKTEVEVLAARPTADFDRSWRTGGIQVGAFVKELYADARRRAGKSWR